MNPNSPKQVAKYLYDELLLKKPLKDLTNEKTLLRLLVKNDVPVINVILEFRELAKETGMLKFSPMENPVWNQQ